MRQQLRTLGGLQLTESDFGRQKLLLLLAYIALEGRQDRDRLARLFWPSGSDPLNSLRVALYQLTKGTREDIVVADENSVATELPADAPVLLAAAAAGDHSRVLDLYRGPFLDGVRLRNVGEEVEEWVYGYRDRVAQAARLAMLVRAEAWWVTGRRRDAGRLAERAWELIAPMPDAEEFALFGRLLSGVHSPLLAEVRAEALELGVELPVEPAPAPDRAPTTGPFPQGTAADPAGATATAVRPAVPAPTEAPPPTPAPPLPYAAPALRTLPTARPLDGARTPAGSPTRSAAATSVAPPLESPAGSPLRSPAGSPAATAAVPGPLDSTDPDRDPQATAPGPFAAPHPPHSPAPPPAPPPVTPSAPPLAALPPPLRRWWRREVEGWSRRTFTLFGIMLLLLVGSMLLSAQAPAASQREATSPHAAVRPSPEPPGPPSSDGRSPPPAALVAPSAT